MTVNNLKQLRRSFADRPAGLSCSENPPGSGIGIRIQCRLKAGWDCCDEYSPGNFVCYSSNGGNVFVGGSSQAAQYQQDYCTDN